MIAIVTDSLTQLVELAQCNYTLLQRLLHAAADDIAELRAAGITEARIEAPTIVQNTPRGSSASPRCCWCAIRN
jgi:hypothetical protein